jgi:hypothetical protein
VKKPPVMPGDLPGYDLKPDPLSVGSVADLILTLRDYRVWAGDPSFRMMAARSGQLASASAICTALGEDALTSEVLPRLPVIMAVVAGCGGDQEDQEAWATAWRLLRLGRYPSAEPRPEIEVMAAAS